MDDETLKIFAYVNISSYRVRSVKALKGEVIISPRFSVSSRTAALRSV